MTCTVLVETLNHAQSINQYGCTHMATVGVKGLMLYTCCSWVKLLLY